jgi:hypothetical protein
MKLPTRTLSSSVVGFADRFFATSRSGLFNQRYQILATMMLEVKSKTSSYQSIGS